MEPFCLRVGLSYLRLSGSFIRRFPRALLAAVKEMCIDCDAYIVSTGIRWREARNNVTLLLWLARPLQELSDPIQLVSNCWHGVETVRTESASSGAKYTSSSSSTITATSALVNPGVSS